ncbi:MAG TPA: ParA family protein, partial [Thermoanaerobaculia bacterium]|nr:ParA family protein [Thermoanaerobaculia bacterium]
EDQGLVQLLIALDQGEDPDVTKHLLRVSETEELYCLPAGVPDAAYARRLNLIDPAAWYREERNPLRELLKKLSTGLGFRPDVVLLDSRTGINQLSGPLLFDLADLAVIAFFPHPQAKKGTAALVKALLAATTRRELAGQELTPEPRFLISPVPASRVPEVVRKYELRSIEWIRDWLADAMNGRSSGPLVEEELAHFIPYREAIATSDQVLEDPDVWRDYAPVSEWIERFLPTRSEERAPATMAELKPEILGEIRFATGTAEQQEHLVETFVETDAVRKAHSSRVVLVRGRKGTGKTALFRRLVEDPSIRSIVVVAPSEVGHQSWLLHADGFAAVDNLLATRKLEWRQFWTAYICLATYYSSLIEGTSPPPPEDSLLSAVQSVPKSELEVVRILSQLLSFPSSGLYVSDWLTRLDNAVGGEVNLLFDGLDTGFGSSLVEKERRQFATEGLMAFLTDRGSGLRNLRLKVLLREDIWKKLRFENKSHLFGRSVSLAWNDKTDYFKVVIKQALQSPGFRRVLESTGWGAGLANKDLGNWAGADVQRAWILLVGERMQGGKTAFTRNWVWNRLADGNDDHSPRYLLQLFHEATVWERAEQRKNPYERSVVRPRALIEVLPTVSERALSALRDEEFPELGPLLEKLTAIGRTPVDARDLEGLEELTDLAREVGLLGIYEVTGDSVERYKVPEIYRYGLGMGRRGQA